MSRIKFKFLNFYIFYIYFEQNRAMFIHLNYTFKRFSHQGSQFTSGAFARVLKRNAIRIRLDGRGRFRDNIFIERLWWTLKYQYLYLLTFYNGLALRRGLRRWISSYNRDRGHSSLDDKTPDEVYYGLPHPFAQAA